MDDQYLRRLGDQSDRLQVAQRVVGQFRIQRRVDGERSNVAYYKVVTVGRRFDDEFDADGAAGAGAIVGHHLLAEHFAEFGRHQPANHVVGAARRERNDQADRFRRVILRAGAGTAQNQCAGQWE